MPALDKLAMDERLRPVEVSSSATGHLSAHATEKGFRPDIEGLRGIAVLLVVAYHAGVPGFSGGYVGVDVFFVLSGYLITSILTAELGRTGRIDFVRFYGRRARRLLPAAALVLFCTLVSSFIIYSPVEQRLLAGTSVATAAYASNLWFIRQATDYLATATSANPLLHTWSLAVEEQFYLFWPLFLLLGTWRARDHRRMLVFMIVISLLSLGACIWFTSTVQPLAFFGSPMRAWEFGIGGLASMVSPGLVSRPVTGLLGWLGLLAVIAAGLLFTHETAFPGSAVVLPAAGTALALIPGAMEGAFRPTRILRDARLQWLGRHSYSWYLWHWPVLVIAGALVARPLPSGTRVSLALLSLGFAAVTFRLIENPVRHSAWLAKVPRRSMVLAACLTAFGVVSGLAWRQVAGIKQESSQQQRFTRASEDVPRLYADGCHATFERLDSGGCVYGDQLAKTTVVLFGDSHAAQWFPAVEEIALRQHWRLVSLTKSSCPVTAAPVRLSAYGRPYWECAEWRSRTLLRIKTLNPALVLLSEADSYLNAGLVGDSSERAESWRRGTQAVLEHLGSVPMLWLRDTPRPGFDVPACLARAAWRPWSNAGACSVPRSDALDGAAWRLEQAAGAGMSKVAFVDLSDSICGARMCAPVLDGRVVYRDDHHLTATFARNLVVPLEQAISTIHLGAQSQGS